MLIASPARRTSFSLVAYSDYIFATDHSSRPMERSVAADRGTWAEGFRAADTPTFSAAVAYVLVFSHRPCEPVSARRDQSGGACSLCAGHRQADTYRRSPGFNPHRAVSQTPLPLPCESTPNCAGDLAVGGGEGGGGGGVWSPASRKGLNLILDCVRSRRKTIVASRRRNCSTMLLQDDPDRCTRSPLIPNSVLSMRSNQPAQCRRPRHRGFDLTQLQTVTDFGDFTLICRTLTSPTN